METTLSVITICYQNPDELISTCNSVDKQSRLPDEHLIIDGSADNHIINWLNNTAQPPYRKWIHEEDKGIADAFNKGIKNATGHLIHFLNSGDSYYDPGAIKTVSACFENDPALMWLHSKYVQYRGGIHVISGLPFDKKKLWKGMRQVAHPSMFIKKELYDRYGFFDTELKIAMDYDFLLRIRDEKFIFLDIPLVCFAPGGASDKQFIRGLQEVRNSYRKHIGTDVKQVTWQWRQRMLHFFMQTGLGKNWFSLKNRKKQIL
ncbi:MAG TPA: glycosyltransferase [Chitinophagaceae bacterium]|nr:glycosyltransferase [Chitinophagaceae bacterium]